MAVEKEDVSADGDNVVHDDVALDGIGVEHNGDLGVGDESSGRVIDVFYEKSTRAVAQSEVVIVLARCVVSLDRDVAA